MTHKIGGFFGLHREHDPASGTLPTLWQLDTKSVWAFENGRSALHALLQHIRPKRFWLPAYCCTSLAEAAQGIDLHYYPLKDLSPDVDFLRQQVTKGDAVLAIDYFGRNPNAAFLNFVKEHPNIHWIEDRAQAFLPAAQAWGKYILYSPRKLLGVADGGIIVSDNLPEMDYDAAIEPDTTHPAFMRADDVSEANNAAWYGAYVAVENAQKVSRRAMSQASKRILESANAHTIMATRKTNYALLMQSLSDVALLPDDTSFVPMGFPIRVRERRMLAEKLHTQDIFAAHHWPELPSPADFKSEHQLAASILTLPCDHRYGIDDMQRIIRAVKEAL